MWQFIRWTRHNNTLDMNLNSRFSTWNVIPILWISQRLNNHFRIVTIALHLLICVECVVLNVMHRRFRLCNWIFSFCCSLSLSLCLCLSLQHTVKYISNFSVMKNSRNGFSSLIFDGWNRKLSLVFFLRVGDYFSYSVIFNTRIHSLFGIYSLLSLSTTIMRDCFFFSL